jgi:hypothetical protein
MAQIKVALNPIGVTNKVILIIEKVSDLGTAIHDPIVFNPPHTQRNFTVADLPAEMMRFFFWESVDGVTLDNNLGSCDIDGSLAYDALIEIFEFQVAGPGDNDPADLATEYINTALKGADLAQPGVTSTSPVGVYQVQQRGIGLKRYDELQNNADPGGFSLLNDDKFSDGDYWFVTLYKKIVSAPQAASAGSTPAEIQEIEELVTVMDNTHWGKELVPVGEMGICTFQAMDLAIIPDKKYFFINTHRFIGEYVVLDLSNGGDLYVHAEEVSLFYIPADQVVGFMVKDHKLHLITPAAFVKERGKIVGGWNPTERGKILADGAIYPKAEVPGLYDMVEELPVGVACSFADRDILTGGEKLNRGRWAIDPGTERIMVPDLSNLFRRFIKPGDAERVDNVPGGVQIDKLKAHSFDGTFRQGKSDDNESGVSGGYLRQLGTGGGSNYGNITQTFNVPGGPETRPINYAEYPLITL